MNTISPGKISQLTIKKIVFPALFGLIALAAQMMSPVASLYAQGSTIVLQTNIKDASILCMSFTINKSNSPQLLKHLHNHMKPITIDKTANAGDTFSIQPHDNHVCNDNSLGTINVTIPTSTSAGLTCTFDLDDAVLKAKTATPTCQ